jgi:hypothetical protein
MSPERLPIVPSTTRQGSGNSARSDPSKPAIPDGPLDPIPSISVDTSEGSPFAEVLRTATRAADNWMFSDEGPYKRKQTAARATHGQITEALLHLLELGLIDIDVERLNSMKWIPISRTRKESDHDH